jgi:hypothetical protein
LYKGKQNIIKYSFCLTKNRVNKLIGAELGVGLGGKQRDELAEEFYSRHLLFGDASEIVTLGFDLRR